MSSSQKSIALRDQLCAGHCEREQVCKRHQRYVARSLRPDKSLRILATQFTFLMALIVSMPSFAQEPEQASATEKLAFQETIEQLKAQSKTDEAAFLVQQKAMIDKLGKNPDAVKRGVIFGRLVVSQSDNPQFCDAQMPIHPSGWFVGDVGNIEEPVEFRMWGYHPARVKHSGPREAIMNVGDILLKPFRFDELGTVRAELLFEGKVDPAAASVTVTMEHPPVNSWFNGTDGYIPRPDKERIPVGPDFRIQRTGLTPIPHYLSIKAPKHLPFHREFKLAHGGTADLGVLRIAASPTFEVEIAIADGLDFTDVIRNKQIVYAGDQFKTNPAAKDWVEAGTLEIQEWNGEFTLRGGLAFLIVTDLGEGTLDDHLKPAHRELQRAQLNEPPKLIDGHVYLVTHSMKKMWKHSTLMRVKMSMSQPN